MEDVYDAFMKLKYPTKATAVHPRRGLNSYDGGPGVSGPYRRSFVPVAGCNPKSELHKGPVKYPDKGQEETSALDDGVMVVVSDANGVGVHLASQSTGKSVPAGGSNIVSTGSSGDGIWADQYCISSNFSEDLYFQIDSMDATHQSCRRSRLSSSDISLGDRVMPSDEFTPVSDDRIASSDTQHSGWSTRGRDRMDSWDLIFSNRKNRADKFILSSSDDDDPSRTQRAQAHTSGSVKSAEDSHGRHRMESWESVFSNRKSRADKFILSSSDDDDPSRTQRVEDPIDSIGETFIKIPTDGVVDGRCGDSADVQGLPSGHMGLHGEGADGSESDDDSSSESTLGATSYAAGFMEAVSSTDSDISRG